MGSRESPSVLFRYSGVIAEVLLRGPCLRLNSKKEEVLHSLGNRAKTGLSMLSSKDSSGQAYRDIDIEKRVLASGKDLAVDMSVAGRACPQGFPEAPVIWQVAGGTWHLGNI